MRAADLQQIVIGLLKALDGPDSLQLSPGQIISVLIKEVRGDMAILSFQGTDITARLEVDIPAGERLRCLVKGEKDGQIILKVLTGTGAGITEQALRDILKGLGLPVDQLNVRLLQEMMKQEMPLLPEYARTLSAFARSAGVPQEDLRFAVFLLKQGIPLNMEIFQTVKELFSDMKFLQAGLEKLLTGTGALAGRPGPATGLGQIAAQVNEAITGMQIMNSDGHEIITAKLGAIFRQFLPQTGPAGMPPYVSNTSAGILPHGVQPDAVQGNTAGAGAGLPGHAGPGTAGPRTAAPGSAAPGTAGPMTAVPGTAAPADSSGSRGMITQPGTVNTGLTGQGLTGDGVTGAGPTVDGQPETSGDLLDPAGMSAQRNRSDHDAALPEGRADERILVAARRVAARMAELADQSAAPPDRTLKDSIAARVQKVLEQSIAEKSRQTDLKSLVEKLVTALGTDAKPEHAELIRAANNVVDRLEFMQNINRAEPGRDNILIVYSTVRFEDKQEPLRLLVSYRYDGKNNKKDFTSCKVEVTLHTPGLGLVRCELQVSSRNLTVQFVADNQNTAGIIDGATETLGRRLEELKYRVKMMPCRVNSPEQAGTFPDEKHEIPGLFRVNLRV